MTDQATAGTREYSWRNPPSTVFERTASPSLSRWWKCNGLAKTTSVFGGPSTIAVILDGDVSGTTNALLWWEIAVINEDKCV
jgi:hypothetical protein